eukprot:CAMPEP_0117660750 /NCGR_PEP_ID=MMETSP0804-20121206/7134_1 /TAXON_ID=1074897 /ORGANISM="Tetraselmis astigmatica, Strain CCMP880" /LENGTH=75 /DNA_ID=CAMNT_0005467499 /DNA_START=298 /DNA_END=525 /DNA_ORIENTATION=+
MAGSASGAGVSEDAGGGMWADGTELPASGRCCSSEDNSDEMQGLQKDPEGSRGGTDTEEERVGRGFSARRVVMCS